MSTTPGTDGGAAGWAATWTMAKRFTATEKWCDRWFRHLSATLKLGYLYLLDSCDVAGVIELDRELANFQIGSPVDWDELVTESAGRIDVLPSGRLWVTKFIEYQYGTLTETCAPHRAVLSILEKHSLKERVLKGYYRGINTPKDKDKDKDKEKDSSFSEGGCKGETLSDVGFEAFWSVFPRGRKGAKKEARKAWQKAIKDGANPDRLIAAATEYAASPVGQGEYVKGPAPWLNQGCWEDDRASWQRSDVPSKTVGHKTAGYEYDPNVPTKHAL